MSVIDFKTRQFVAPAEPLADEPKEIKVCTKSVRILEAMLNDAKLGELRMVHVLGLKGEFPQVVRTIGGSFTDLSVLSVGVSMMGDMICEDLENFLGTSALMTPDPTKPDLDPEPGVSA